MRAPTPFNPQSTRGFNIKKFYVKVIKKEEPTQNEYEIVGLEEDWYYIDCSKNSLQGTDFMKHTSFSSSYVASNDQDVKEVYLINVPGFEPPNGVAAYSQIDPSNFKKVFTEAAFEDGQVGSGSVVESQDKLYYSNTFVSNLNAILNFDPKILDIIDK